MLWFTRMQTPVVGLVCGFRPPRPSEPTLLSHGEVETLFHEMGHAMHCMSPCSSLTLSVAFVPGTW